MNRHSDPYVLVRHGLSRVLPVFLPGSDSAVQKRRSVPIHAYVGPNGAGKSLCMVRDTIPSMRAGRQVLSTVKLLELDGSTYPGFELFTDWRQLLEAEHCDILMDEVTGIASARETSTLPSEVVNVLVQLRRRDILLRWTSPSWARADRIIREVTQAVTICHGFLPDRALGQHLQKSQTGLWMPNRVFTFRTYNAQDYSDFNQQSVAGDGISHDLRPVLREHWASPGREALRRYDTYDAVSQVGQQIRKGICPHCGGIRRPKVCHCED